jgi:hypothetical protein
MCLFSFPCGGVPKGWVYGRRLVFVSLRTNKRHHHHHNIISLTRRTVPRGTVPRVLVRRTASPTHADFGGLSSGAPPVVVRLDVVSFPPSSSLPTVAGCLLGGYPVGRDWWGGKISAGGMSEGKKVFAEHFRQVFFNTNALPRINIGADVWGESSIMTGVYQCWCSPTCTLDGVCVIVYV